MGRVLYTEAVAKSDRLLQAVLERPDDASVLRVYGDALQARGETRGALLSVQLLRREATTERLRRLLKLQEQQLLRAHHAELHGPLAAIRELTAVWRTGFVRELHLSGSRPELEHLTQALEQPALALLERLELRLVRGDAESLEPVLSALPPGLRHLALRVPEPDWSAVIDALPDTLRSLELGSNVDVDFEGLSLPAVERLWVSGGLENLTHEVAPKLELLTLGNGDDLGELPELPEGLRLLRLFGSTWDDVELEGPSRVVHEWSPDRSLYERRMIAGSVSRGGWGVAGERALLITEGGAPQVDDAFAEVEHLVVNQGHELRCALVPVGPLKLCAVELRCLRPGKTLLAELAAALSTRAFTLELAASSSNGDVLMRGYRNGKVEPLAMGPYRGREDVWRAGIDHAFGFDPGRTLDLVCEALDAELPRRSNGDPADSARGEWACATPLQPTDDPRDYDEYGEFYEDEDAPIPDWWSAPAGPDEGEEPRVDAPPEVAPETVELAEEQHAEREEDAAEPVEHEEQGDREWAHVMEESPVELEDDGSERNPEEGLEDQPIDYEGMHVEPEHVCFRCERGDLPLERCEHCGHEVCGRCAYVSVEEQVRCNVCR